MKYIRIILLGVFAFLVGIGVFSSLKIGAASSIPFDSPQGQEVLRALENAYEVLDTPYDVVDLNKFDEVFIDHPIYRQELGSEAAATLQSQISKRLRVSSASVEQFGYLTSIKSKRLRQQEGAKLLKQALQEAKTQGRTLSKPELDQLTAKNLGFEPTLPDMSLPSHHTLTYLSIKLEGDTARVAYDEGVVYRTAILVKVKGQWFVAGIL